MHRGGVGWPSSSAPVCNEPHRCPNTVPSPKPSPENRLNAIDRLFDIGDFAHALLNGMRIAGYIAIVLCLVIAIINWLMLCLSIRANLLKIRKYKGASAPPARVVHAAPEEEGGLGGCGPLLWIRTHPPVSPSPRTGSTPPHACRGRRSFRHVASTGIGCWCG